MTALLAAIGGWLIADTPEAYLVPNFKAKYTISSRKVKGQGLDNYKALH